MRDAVRQLNKRAVADATGVSYGRLRKYASGIINELTAEEMEKIHTYLLMLAKEFNTK